MRMVVVLMATLASTPGSGVGWADVVRYLEAAKAKGMLSADDEKWLAVYRQKAAQGSVQPGSAQPAPGSTK
jgi:membrane protein YqaA with SNARE-associated domain